MRRAYGRATITVWFSAGAVGAFMAAWNRPDQFHRVLSLIGTYVAMKGADGSISSRVSTLIPLRHGPEPATRA